MQSKTTEEFIKEVEERFPDEVSFEKTEYKGANSLCIITCPKHGDVPTTPHNVLRKRNITACPLCGREQGHINQNQGKERFLKKLYERFPGIKYDFSEAEYIDSSTHMNVICHEKDCNGVEHGAWSIKPYNLYTGYGCPKCRAEKVRQEHRMPYEDYCKLVSEKYGDIYEVDKETYEDKSDRFKIWCKKHRKYFEVNSREFPKYNSHKCPDCFNDDLQENEIEANTVLSFAEETWLDIPGYEGKYQCSSEGRFKRINRKHRSGNEMNDLILKVNYSRRMGHISLDGKTYSAHRVIYEAFHNVKLPNGYSVTIDHIDNNIRNNSISNLRIGGTISENMMNNKLTVARLSARGGAVGVTCVFDYEDLEGEEWTDVMGYEEFYKISNFGRVAAKDRNLIERNTGKKRLKKSHLMRQTLKYGQYYTVGLVDGNGIHKTHYIHRLVYESFNGKIKEGNQVDHIDSNPLNNMLDNLREVTPLENARNLNSLSKRTVTVKKLNLHGETIAVYASVKEAGIENNINPALISSWINRNKNQRKNKLKGFYFSKLQTR